MAGSSRPHGNRDALLTAVAAVAVVVAGAVSPRVDVHLPAGVWEARAQALALEASGATALWMRAVPTFGQAIVDQARHQADQAGVQHAPMEKKVSKICKRQGTTTHY